MAKQKPNVTVDQTSAVTPASGSQSTAFGTRLLRGALKVVNTDWEDETARNEAVRGTVAAMKAGKPQTEIEGMLMAQMVAAHECAMECYARSQLTGQSFEGRALNLTHAAKLSRTFAALLETLDKHRGKSNQTISVVHQHINAQASQSVNVAGAVHRGEGVEPKMEEQPHEHESEPVADQPALPDQSPLRGAEPLGPALQGAGNEGADPVPLARRQSDRGA